MSNYHKKLVQTIEDSNLWPTLDRPDFLHVLDETAANAFSRHTTEGYLAAFLIYQQISEDMVKNVIRLGRLFNQASVFPLEIKYEPLDGLTFGILLKQLAAIPHEPSGLLMSTKCSELNNLRGKLVHKITQKESLEDIENKCKQAYDIFKEIEAIYFEVEDGYRIGLSHYRKNVINTWKKEYIKILS